MSLGDSMEVNVECIVNGFLSLKFVAKVGVLL